MQRSGSKPGEHSSTVCKWQAESPLQEKKRCFRTLSEDKCSYLGPENMYSLGENGKREHTQENKGVPHQIGHDQSRMDTVNYDVCSFFLYKHRINDASQQDPERFF